MSSYGFGAQAHQYNIYRQQAHIMQAAYSNAQHASNRVTNPQQIADSIYNMAAHVSSTDSMVFADGVQNAVGCDRRCLM